MSDYKMVPVKRCAACGNAKPVSEMETCMHNQMHRYVCDSKCMNDFYNPPKNPRSDAAAPDVQGEPVAMSNDKMRAEFEKWAVVEGLTLHGKDGRYLKEIQSAWMAYQASRAALAVDLPFEFVNGMMRADQVIAAIEAAGVRVKP